MKHPYISAIYPLEGPDATRPAEAFVQQTGQNTGNLIFSASVLRLVDGLALPPSRITDPQAVAADCDGVVIAAANWLQPSRDLAEMAAFLDALDKPVVVTGLGAQASAGRIPELPEGTIRFLHLVAERSHSISVRGAFSAEVLDHYGVRDVAVTGCPSLLYHLSRPAQIAHRPDPGAPLRVALNGGLPEARTPSRDSARKALGRFMLQEALRLEAPYVAQTELSLMHLARGGLAEGDAATWAFLADAFGIDDRAVMRTYAERHLQVFGTAEAWIAWCAAQDLIVGTRLHGVIAALLAGRPALLLTHDSRTEEMARHAAIPFVPAQQVQAHGRIDPDALLAQVDVAGFNARQRGYFSDFIRFFEANEVPHRLGPAPGAIASH